ncbi:MAG: accessory gene regulator ArgB-like protein [bacterium]|jgi:accessory gene regulator B
MLSLKSWAQAVTYLLEKVYPLGTQQREVIEYGLVIALSTLAGLGLLILVAAALGLLFPTLLVLLAAGSLRLSAGGAHCSAPWRCNLLGVLVFPALGYTVSVLSAYKTPAILVYVILSLTIAVGTVFWQAPVLTANKPLSALRRQRLCLRARATVLGVSALALFFLSRGFDQAAIGLATGLLWQGFTLLPLGWQVIGSFDQLLSGGYTTRRREGY